MMKTPYYFLFLIGFFLFQISVSFAQNEKPVAVDDHLIVHSWGTYTINVLDNDYDPDGDSIFIDKVYDTEGFEITYTSSQVFVTITSTDEYLLSIRYRINDINGKSDKAYINIVLEEHPDAVHPIADTILAENQVPIELNLLENDIYNGLEDLKLVSVTSWYQGNIEILPDSQTIRFVSDAYNGPGLLSYVVAEKGGSEYVSFGRGFIFVRKNEDAPIVRADTFEVQAGQVSFLDVLANDTPQENIVVHSILGNEFLSIENSKIKFDVPENYSNRISFRYDILNTENGFKSIAGLVIVDIQSMANIPVAVIDTVEYVYTIEDVEVFPLGNDINPSGNGLVIHETGTESLFVNFSNKTGWFDKTYQAKDTVTGLISELNKIYIHVLPPDSIQVQDFYINYTMGDIIDIDPYEGTNLPDTIQYLVDTEIGRYAWYNNTYSFDVNRFDGLINNEWNDEYELSDRIEITFNVIDGNQLTKVVKYIYVNYVSSSFYSILGINNVDLTVSPNGFHYGNIKYPNQSYTQPLYMLQPWMSDYTNQEVKRVSGNASVYDGADFVSGPLVDDYSAEYQEKYYRTWKVSKNEIQQHKYNWNNSDYQIPESILSWPSQQTIYNGVSYEGADYIDVNENGFYDPENGDYPKITGDEAILYIVNDGRYRNGEDGPTLDSLCVDIYTLVYAFNRPYSDYFNNTFFIKYKVVNKSTINYEDFKLGLYTKNDYGNIDNNGPNKLFIACDTQLNTFYSYPGLNIAPSESYWPIKPPITLFSILNQNLDKFTEVVTGHSFWPDNYSAQKRYHYLNGTWDENLNHPYPCWSLNAPIDYVYPDHPLDFGADNSLSNQNICYSDSDAQMLGVSGSHILSSGESMEFEYAIQFYYHPESGYGESIDGALANVANLLECYQNDSIPGGGSFTGINEQMTKTQTDVFIYPNPARTTLYIQTESKNFETYRIYSLHGQLLEESNFNSEISIQHLPPGFYFLTLIGENGKMEATRKFVKQ